MLIQQIGMTIWLTGLSGSGKTTIGQEVANVLSKADRDENIRRIGFVSHLLTKHGVVVVVAAISPYREIRQEVRKLIGNFIEIYVNAPLDVCEQRDVKGLYKKARSGEINNFTGVDDPYEPPLTHEVECLTNQESINESVQKVLQKFWSLQNIAM
jgi:adenylylsulfate kinase